MKTQSLSPFVDNICYRSSTNAINSSDLIPLFRCKPALYDRALRIDPNYSDVLKDKGLALDKLGRYEEAIKCYDKASEINPRLDRIREYRDSTLSNFADYELNKGISLYNSHRYDEAIEWFNRSLEKKLNVQTWDYKGLAFTSLGFQFYHQANLPFYFVFHE
jgi:tetratricopeptide (TPR) repeat protein